MVVVGNNPNRPEMRKKPRRSFHYHAKIVKDNDMQVTCAIADISHSGARLHLEMMWSCRRSSFCSLRAMAGRTGTAASSGATA